MVQWIPGDSCESGVRMVEITPEMVAEVASQVVADFANGELTSAEISEKYQAPIENVYTLGGTIISLSRLVGLFDDGENYHIDNIDPETLKTLFAVAFLIGYRLNAVAAQS